MRHVKELVLRLYGDQGSDTIDRLASQVEYTADLCIQMLDPTSGIEAVIPEWLEDISLEHRDYEELIQVKTRDESVGFWTIAEVLPILCALYHRRHAVGRSCRFRFVSDGSADPRPASARSYGSLYRLKELLLTLEQGDPLTPGETALLADLRARVCPRVTEIMYDQYHESLGEREAWELLLRTFVDTNSPVLRGEPDYAALDRALDLYRPGLPARGIAQLRNLFDRLVKLIFDRVRQGTDRASRKIVAADIGALMSPLPVPESLPSLDAVPGTTVLEKKLHLGGFDPTMKPTFNREWMHAKGIVREMAVQGATREITRYTTAALNRHGRLRMRLSRELPETDLFGPALWESLDQPLADLAQRELPEALQHDESFRIGILWDTTNDCASWWHRARTNVSE